MEDGLLVRFPVRLRAVLIVLLTAAGVSQAAPLGLEYARQLAPGLLTAGSTIAAALDASGNAYLLATGDPTNLPVTTVIGTEGSPAYFVMKLTPDARIAYLTRIDPAQTLAVDASGSVYLVAQNRVMKLNAAGTALDYTTTIGDGLLVAGIAADASGRAYLTGWTSTAPLRTTKGAFQETAPNQSSHAYAVKLSAAGAVEYATYVAGSVTEISNGIAVDATGAAFIRGRTQSPDFPLTAGAYKTGAIDPSGGAPFVARLAPDGSRLLYATLTGEAAENAQAIAVDPSGNAVVASQDNGNQVTLVRFDGRGALMARSQPLPPVRLAYRTEALAVDAAGNAYLTGLATSANYPAKNSLARCGSLFVSVFDTANNLVQSSFLGGSPGSAALPVTAIAAGSGGVSVAGPAGAAFDPMLAARLSSDAPARPVKLACIGNAASFDAGVVAPGEIVSLFGQGLGPQEGAQPQVTIQSGFPARFGGVQVTFDGMSAPLLYAQDAQINAIAPWRLKTGQTTTICASYNGAAPECLERSVAAAAPGVFTTDGTHAAALNQDGTINSLANPAAPGSVVSIFATGLGPLNPLPADGAILDAPLPAPVLPIMPAAVIGGIFFSIVGVPVQYAGPAPLEVAGVSQINFRAAGSRMVLVVGPELFAAGAAQSKGFSIYVSGGVR